VYSGSETQLSAFQSFQQQEDIFGGCRKLKENKTHAEKDKLYI